MSDSIEFPIRADEDGKGWFYLDHRDDIEEWAALRDVAREVVEQYFWALQPALEAWAESEDAEVVVIDHPTWPRLGLTRPEWRSPDLPAVEVVIEWNRKTFLVPMVANEWPYTAVRVDAGLSPQHPVFSAFAPIRKRLQGNANGPWPFWRYELLERDDDALNPEELARLALRSLRELWAAAAPVLDSLTGARP